MAHRGKDWPTIRERKRLINDNAVIDFCIDCGIMDSKRRQYFRKTMKEAQEFAQLIRKECMRHGELAFKLTSEQRVEAARCYEMLGDIPLVKAVKFYMDKHPTEDGPEVPDVLKERLDEMKNRNCRERSIVSTQSRLEPFVKRFRNYPITAVTTANLIAWLNSYKDWSPVTKKNFIVELRAFFNFAKRRSYIRYNPADDLELPIIEQKMPKFMAVEDVEKFLHWFTHPQAVEATPFAVAFFAGVRPAELKKLTMGDIAPDLSIITINPKIAKCRSARHITISDNLRKWIMNDERPSASGKIAHPYHDEQRRAVCRKLDIKWSADIARHTFATMHLAMHQDAALTAHEMGHTNGTDILYKHYRGLATKEEAERFWSIVPA